MSTTPTRWAFLDWPHPIAFAHRGGAAEWPENTMAAFAASVRLGYHYLETDVRTTADGVLLAFHDARLDRASDGHGQIGELPYETVRRARVGGEPIPRLEEVLDAWPEVRIHLDAKDDASVPPLVAAIDRTGSGDRVCIGSFVSRRAARLRDLTENKVCSWMGCAGIARMRLASLGLPSGRPRASCTQAPVRKGPVTVVDRRFLDTARRLGVAVHVWTIDDRAEMERLLELGVDGILSNRPTLLKQVFSERGLWV